MKNSPNGASPESASLGLKTNQDLLIEEPNIWYQAFETICAITDVGNGFGLSEGLEAIRAKFSELEHERNVANEGYRRASRYQGIAEKQAEDAEAEASASRLLIEELREALEPFARFYRDLDGLQLITGGKMPGDHKCIATVSHAGVGARIELGHFRKAALASSRSLGGGEP